MKKIFSFLGIIFTFFLIVPVNFNASEIRQTEKDYYIPCNQAQEFYKNKTYYCKFYNGSTTNKVYARVDNKDWNASAAGKVKVWLKEENPGPNPTICSYKRYIKPNQYAQCTNDYHNKNEDFYSYAEYYEMDGNWRSISSQVS